MKYSVRTLKEGIFSLFREAAFYSPSVTTAVSLDAVNYPNLNDFGRHFKAFRVHITGNPVYGGLISF